MHTSFVHEVWPTSFQIGNLLSNKSLDHIFKIPFYISPQKNCHSSKEFLMKSNNMPSA